MSVASRRKWDRADILDTLPRISTVNPSRGLGYPSTAESNEATAPQIAAESPSDNIKTMISDAPLFSGRATARADRSGPDGPVCCSYGGGLGVLWQARVGAASAKQVLPE
jgi:hypothetical protein